METGQVNPTMKLENQGIMGLGYVYYNLIEPDLMSEAVKNGEGEIGQGDGSGGGAQISIEEHHEGARGARK